MKHDMTVPVESEVKAAEREIDKLQKENAALRRKIQKLEDRLVMYSGSGSWIGC